jgi:hypothetical protein
MRHVTFWGAVAVTGVLGVIGLNLAADRLPFPALKTLRDYTVRRNG